MQGEPLPDDVLDALRQGRKIEAIKRLREATGLGLAEAKARVEAHEDAGPRMARAMAQPPKELPPQVLQALRAGSKIEAIKRLREATGLGLKEAKDVVEGHRGARTTARPTGLAPGEVPRSSASPIAWILLAVGALAAVGFFLFF